MRQETDIPAYYQQFDHYISLKFDGSAADLVIGMQIIQLRVHMKGEREGEGRQESEMTREKKGKNRGQIDIP